MGEKIGVLYLEESVLTHGGWGSRDLAVSGGRAGIEGGIIFAKGLLVFSL